MRAPWVIGALALALACRRPVPFEERVVDSDGDGLVDRAEVDLGLDPNDPDSDGDGLADGDEIALGSDPLQVDSDGDSLDDAEEVGLGTDPRLPDTDGDRLDDPTELERGTDPVRSDSDDDGYADGDEVDAGHDPLDPEDRIYLGGWPYNPLKDEIADPGFRRAPVQVGETFPRFAEGVDQFGQVVDLYDFGGTDRLTIIDASATWCEPCRITSAWMSGGEDEWDFEILYAPVRAAVDDGRVSWVTVLTQDPKVRADADDVALWDQLYGHPRVPVLTDPNGDVVWAMNMGESPNGTVYPYWPSFVVVDGDMQVVVRGFSWDAFEYVMDALEAEEGTGG